MLYIPSDAKDVVCVHMELLLQHQNCVALAHQIKLKSMICVE